MITIQSKFDYGDLVKDKITGFTGIVAGISQWGFKCVRIGVQSQVEKKDGIPIDPQWFDEYQLEVVKPKHVEFDVTNIVIAHAETSLLSTTPGGPDSWGDTSGKQDPPLNR